MIRDTSLFPGWASPPFGAGQPAGAGRKKKAGSPFSQATRPSRSTRPVAFRPHLAMGLALSWEWGGGPSLKPCAPNTGSFCTQTNRNWAGVSSKIFHHEEIGFNFCEVRSSERGGTRSVASVFSPEGGAVSLLSIANVAPHHPFRHDRACPSGPGNASGGTRSVASVFSDD